jgi:hypothetical protein
LARHIEIELDNPASSLPCSVVDRPNSGSRNVLWRAKHELGFCRKKAEETLAVLKRRGWACRPENSDERQARLKERSADGTLPSNVIAAWRCLEGLAPVIEQAASNRSDIPPALYVPEARPEPQDTPETETVLGRVLLSAVQQDLSVIGQDVVDDEAILGSALGDLNEDGSDDAVIIDKKDRGRAPAHQLVMAYLRSDDAFRLVDVWILETRENALDAPLNVAIEDGKIHLDDCCAETSEPSVLVLDNRKLARADGG